MKIGICGDQHWTNSKPANRTDNYEETVLRKLDWEITTCVERGCAAMVFPGDLFDSYKVPYGLTQKVIQRFRAGEMYHTMDFVCVFGQHDQRYHTLGTENTPLGVLLEAVPSLTLLDDTPAMTLEGDERVHWYGASWGQEIPVPRNENMYNILVMHRMVIGDKKLWEGQTDYSQADKLLKDHPEYDLIITGDNHQRVIARNLRGRAVINMGSMMRSTIAQTDHEPGIAIFDTETKELTIVPIPTQPADKVFAVEKVAVEKERNEKLDLFVNSLQQGEGVETMDFTANLSNFVQSNKEEITEGVVAQMKQMLPADTKLEV